MHAFSELIKNHEESEYQFTLRETETSNIIDDVSNYKSELGVLYLNHFNKKILENVFKEAQLIFTPLFVAKPHVFISKDNPLATKTIITLEDLAPYPCLTFEQGDANSFYFAEEILSTRYSPKSIKVSDRATIFNLMVGVNGYTISSGVLSRKLNDDNIIAVPLDIDDEITIGWISRNNIKFSTLASEYLVYLKQHIKDFGFELI